MSPHPAAQAERSTYADGLTWPEDERRELHDGVAVSMSPAPSTRHQRFVGGPDWVIEVLSPSTSARDQITKLAYYEAYGVRHYWLVHPVDHLVTVYARTDLAQPFPRPAIHQTQGTLASGLFEELTIDWDLVPR